MIPIAYPPHQFKIKEEAGRQVMFDEFRKIWIRITPEEWVRQHFLQYLVQVKKYPSQLIAIEKEIVYGELKKRFDILVYDAAHAPWMMIECKAMHIPFDEKVLHQVLRYNLSVPVPFLLITNGNVMAAFERRASGLIELSALPDAC